MIKRIEAYCNAGKLEGLRVYTIFSGCNFCASNIRFGDYGLLFDQSWGNNMQYSSHGCSFYDHVQEYVWDVLCKIEELISVDRNMF